MEEDHLKNEEKRHRKQESKNARKLNNSTQNFLSKTKKKTKIADHPDAPLIGKENNQ